MKYERTAKHEASGFDGNRGRWAKQQAAGVARRIADRLMREEHDDTEPHLYWYDLEAA